MAREAFGLLPECVEEGFVCARRPQELDFFRILGPEHLDLAHVAQGKAPAQGNHGRRPSREFGDRMCALGVARPMFERHARRKRRDGAEVLPYEPSRLIEFVNAHVHKDSATVGAKVSAGGRSVPLKVG